jgi:anti-sigma regulatory factor (Ser/Thr protein kinase)/predicted transcriptional regulator
MVRQVIHVAPSTEMGELRGILHDNHISGVPVIEDGRLVGIISVEDFIRWLAAGGPSGAISERMTRDVVTVYEDEPLIRAVNKLDRFRFGRLPVLSRAEHQLTGIITNGDIIAGILKKLDVDYRRTEMRKAKPMHIFKDMISDWGELTLEHQVAAGDLDRAGGGASGLKATLLRLGVSPTVARRLAIAAYEAEMNLVFFAGGGQIITRIGSGTIRMEVVDEGPGIADIEQAMQPGFSTAPDWVRELGFGAGMGLHNIKTCADKMDLTSTVGKGTRLQVEIAVEPEGESERVDTAACP